MEAAWLPVEAAGFWAAGPLLRTLGRGDHHPVLATADAWCGCFHIEAGVAKIEATPPAPPLTLIVEWTTLTADPTPLPLAAFRAHVGDDTPVGFLDQALQHTVHHTQNAEPYTPTRHIVSFLHISVERRNRSWCGGVSLSLARYGAAAGRSLTGTHDRTASLIGSSPRPRRGPVTRRGAASWRAEQAASQP